MNFRNETQELQSVTFKKNFWQILTFTAGVRKWRVFCPPDLAEYLHFEESTGKDRNPQISGDK